MERNKSWCSWVNFKMTWDGGGTLQMETLVSFTARQSFYRSLVYRRNTVTEITGLVGCLWLLVSWVRCSDELCGGGRERPGKGTPFDGEGGKEGGGRRWVSSMLPDPRRASGRKLIRWWLRRAAPVLLPLHLHNWLAPVSGGSWQRLLVVG